MRFCAATVVIFEKNNEQNILIVQVATLSFFSHFQYYLPKVGETIKCIKNVKTFYFFGLSDNSLQLKCLK